MHADHPWLKWSLPALIVVSLVVHLVPALLPAGEEPTRVETYVQQGHASVRMVASLALAPQAPPLEEFLPDQPQIEPVAEPPASLDTPAEPLTRDVARVFDRRRDTFDPEVHRVPPPESPPERRESASDALEPVTEPPPPELARTSDIEVPPAEVTVDFASLESAASTEASGAVDNKPALIANPDPPYPDELRLARKLGAVVLTVLVSTEGRAKSVTLRKSSGHPALDESALTTVRNQWRWHPAQRMGQPVEYYIHFELNFRER